MSNVNVNGGAIALGHPLPNGLEAFAIVNKVQDVQHQSGMQEIGDRRGIRRSASTLAREL